ncbi:hypothetical protein BSKO_03381 [Bryopsis sp. KO-2023]|nr:hypothetical protein BSKO_03381 [Bryopsis sp. KO-2023]
MFAQGRRSNTISPSEDPDVFAKEEHGGNRKKVDCWSAMTRETYSSDPHMASGDLESLLVKLTAELKTLRHEVEAIDDDDLDDNDDDLFSNLIGNTELPFLLQEIGGSTSTPPLQNIDKKLESQFSGRSPTSGRLHRLGSGIPKPQGCPSNRDAVEATSVKQLSPDLQNLTMGPSRIPKPPTETTGEKGMGKLILGGLSKTDNTIQGRDYFDKTTEFRERSEGDLATPVSPAKHKKEEDERFRPGSLSGDSTHLQPDGCRGKSLRVEGSGDCTVSEHSSEEDESLSSFESLVFPGAIAGDLEELASIDPFCSSSCNRSAAGNEGVENSAGTMAHRQGSSTASRTSVNMFFGEEGQLCDIESDSETWLYDPQESSEDDALSKASFDVIPPTRLIPIKPCDWPASEKQPSKGNARCGDHVHSSNGKDKGLGSVGAGMPPRAVVMSLGCDRDRDEVDSSNLGCQTSVSDDGDIMRFRMSSWGSSGGGSNGWRGDFPFCVDSLEGNACMESWDGRLGMEARHSTATTSLPLVVDTFPHSVQLLDTHGNDMPCIQDDGYIEIGMMDSSESSVLEWNFSSPTSKDADENNSLVATRDVGLGGGQCGMLKDGSQRILGLGTVGEEIESRRGAGGGDDADSKHDDLYHLHNELKKLHGYPPVVFDELLSPSSSDGEVLEETRFDLRGMELGCCSGTPTESSDDFLDNASDETSDEDTSDDNGSETGCMSDFDDIDIEEACIRTPSPRSVIIPSLDLSTANMIFSDPTALWNPQLPLQSTSPSESTARESISINSVSVRDWIASSSSFKSATPETPTATTLVPSMIHPWGISLDDGAGLSIPNGCMSVGQNPLWIPMMDCEDMGTPRMDPAHDKEDVASQDSFSFGQIGSVGLKSSSSTGLEYMDPAYESSCDESTSCSVHSVEEVKIERTGIGKDPASLPVGRQLWYPRPKMGVCKRLYHSLKRGKRSSSGRQSRSQKGFTVCFPFARKKRREQWDWSWERPFSNF